MTARSYPAQADLKTNFDYAKGHLVHRPRIDRMGRKNTRYVGQVAGNEDSKGRWRVTLDGTFYEGHRLIWIWHKGPITGDAVIDHVDGNPLNNKIENLRLATVSQNNANRQVKTAGATSKFYGVSWNSRREKWVAQAKKDSKVSYIGSFETELEAAKARDAFVRGLHDGFEVLNFPDMLNEFDLHDYQRRAQKFVVDNKSCALFLDCGLGKTVVTLSALAELFDTFEIGKVLVVAPLRVAQTVWQQEAPKWHQCQHLKFSQILGSVAERKKAIAQKADIYLVNYENLPWLIENCDFDFDTIVFDELSKMKSPQAQRFKRFKKILHKVDRVIGLTATPAANGLIGVWSQIFLLDRGERLGKTITAYKDRYFISDYHGYNWSLRKGADQKIYDKLEGLCLTLSADDYLDLPKAVTQTIDVDIPPAAREQYQQLERDFLLDMGDDEIVEVLHAAALTNKLLQFANGAIYTDDTGAWSQVHDAKLDALSGIVDSAVGQPLLVSYNFKTDAMRLRERFPQAELIGRDPETIARWNRGEIPMMIAHPASAGHGLNLQHGGHNLVWFGLNWSLELYLQFNKRLDRQGQTKPVTITHLAVKDTVDTTVLDALTRKDIGQRALLNALKQDIRGRT